MSTFSVKTHFTGGRQELARRERIPSINVTTCAAILSRNKQGTIEIRCFHACYIDQCEDTFVI